MPSKRAAQRIAAEMGYSPDESENPLLTMRLAHSAECTQRDYAAFLQVGRGVISQAEDGMYPLIPTCYRRHITAMREVNHQYQAFRRARRAIFWDKLDFPDKPSARYPMQKLLEHFELADYTFASRMCVPHADIHKLKHSARSLTGAMTEALEQIGLDEIWINEFNASLARSHKPRLHLTSAT